MKENEYGEFEPFVSFIENDVANKIWEDIYVSPDELIIVNADFHLNEKKRDELSFNIGFLLRKSTFEKLHLREHYLIYPEDREVDKAIADVSEITEAGNVHLKRYQEYVNKYKWDIEFPIPNRGVEKIPVS